MDIVIVVVVFVIAVVVIIVVVVVVVVDCWDAVTSTRKRQMQRFWRSRTTKKRFERCSFRLTDRVRGRVAG